MIFSPRRLANTMIANSMPNARSMPCVGIRQLTRWHAARHSCKSSSPPSAGNSTGSTWHPLISSSRIIPCSTITNPTSLSTTPKTSQWKSNPSPSKAACQDAPDHALVKGHPATVKRSPPITWSDSMMTPRNDSIGSIASASATQAHSTSSRAKIPCTSTAPKSNTNWNNRRRTHEHDPILGIFQGGQ